MIDFADLPWDDEVLRFHDSKALSATVRRPIYASSIDKWRHHAEALAPLRARLSRVLAAQDLL
jgi:hypothetical protein